MTTEYLPTFSVFFIHCFFCASLLLILVCSLNVFKQRFLYHNCYFIGVINEENNHVHQKKVISERETLKKNNVPDIKNIEEINGNRILRNVTAEEALAYFNDEETNENRILRNVTAEEAIAYFSR